MGTMGSIGMDVYILSWQHDLPAVWSCPVVPIPVRAGVVVAPGPPSRIVLNSIPAERARLVSLQPTVKLLVIEMHLALTWLDHRKTCCKA